MQNRKRDTDIKNRLLDSVGEDEGGMFSENSIETNIYYQGWNRSPAQVGYMLSLSKKKLHTVYPVIWQRQVTLSV